jgi:N-acetylglucosamine kinase-like BadF-type ATPase
MTYYIGIDGGGSNLRVAIVDDDLTIVRQVHMGKANPHTSGFDASTHLIQTALRDVTHNFDAPICAVGIGISGAPRMLYDRWLRETVLHVLPNTRVVPSSDQEIALVGANGEPLGVLILAGTGSIGCGINEHGESLTVGGWGYLMGDKGSGFWLGIQALQAYVRQAEGTQERPSRLYERVLEACGFSDYFQIVPYLYGESPPKTNEIAKLASIVLEEADNGDWQALEIIDEGAHELAHLTHSMMRRLHMPHAKIAFAGGLLTNDTPLARKLCEKLNLPSIPQPQYSALIGAALLAKITYEKEQA